MSDEPKNDYKDTLNLPNTDFPMKANLNQREPDIHQKWAEMQLDKVILAQRSPERRYVLHDGPPYANGDIHMGHALNKILKDFIVRYKTMKGFYARYVPGWDCHGLPIEQKVREKLGSAAREKTPLEIRQLCKEYALKWVNTQIEQFQRLGIGGDFDNPYRTLNYEYEVGELKAFRALVENGLIYRGRKPVFWCASCGTALADAEVEYENHTSHSIFVRFPILNKEKCDALKDVNAPSIVIWTTTPWTLPANVAVAVHPDFDYVAARLKSTGEVFVVAHYLMGDFLAKCNLGEADILAQFKGGELNGLECRHPLLDKKSVVVLGNHVTLEAGTGCVHTAPGHGYDDYLMLLKYNLPMVMPVDDTGRFTEEFPLMKGMSVWDANKPIVDKLAQDGILVGSGKVEHSYPHCWRCHKPIIFRATEQWFMSVEKNDLRQNTLRTIDNVRWIPSWGRDRIYNMVAMRPDWCLSRQRKWGVPIPALQCEDCKSDILDIGVIDLFTRQVAEKGSDAWFSESAQSVIPEGFKCPYCGGTSFKKKTDTLDVWFDSGASHIAVCEQRKDLGSPVDLYLEGSDQHRGWFQSSLLVAMGASNRAPYKAVLTHGFILDSKGEAMSKSKGNVIPPQKIIEKMGADVLRLWVASEDYREDVKISHEILDRISDAYRRIRNTFRFLLGNLGDFRPEQDAVSYEKLPEIDRWALHKLYSLMKRVTKAYEDFEFHKVYHFVHSFCVVEMSALYLDIIKDRLYVEGRDSLTRRAAQTVIHFVADYLVRLIAPVLPFTMEEVFQSLETTLERQTNNPFKSNQGADGKPAGFGKIAKSVHAELLPEPREVWNQPALEETWEKLLRIREAVVKVLEDARRRKEIGHSLDAKVTFATTSDEIYSLLEDRKLFLADLCIVSSFEIKKVKAFAPGDAPVEEFPEVSIKAEKAPWEKCARCWKLHPETGKNARHPGTCPRCAGVLSQQKT